MITNTSRAGNAGRCFTSDSRRRLRLLPVDCSERGVLPIQELIDRANKSQNAMLPKCKLHNKEYIAYCKTAKNISALTATRLTMAVTIKLA